MDIERLTARNKNGLAYLVKVKPNEQEVDSPYKNTLKCILDCFERLAQYEEAEIARQSVTSEEVAEAIEWQVSLKDYHQNKWEKAEPEWQQEPGAQAQHNEMIKAIDLAIAALQAYQLPSAIKWTGDNLREVINLTGWNESASSKWTWEEYEQIVREKGLKIFTSDGSVIANIGSWIVREGNNCQVLQEYQPWVSVEDRPRKDNKYLAVLQFYKEPKDKTIEVVEYYGEWKVNYEWNVICYKPLPEPPKGE